MGGFEPWQVSIGLGVGAGRLLRRHSSYWGNRFTALSADDDHGHRVGRRRASWSVAVFGMNHSAGWPVDGVLGLVAVAARRPLRAGRCHARGARHAGRHQRGASGRPRRDHGPLLGVPGHRPDHRQRRRAARAAEWSGHRRSADRLAPGCCSIALVPLCWLRGSEHLVGAAASPELAPARRRPPVPTLAIGGPCASPSSSSRPCATTPPMPRWRRIGCSCAPATCASSDRGSTPCCRSASAVQQRIEQVIREEIDAHRRAGDGDAGRPSRRPVAASRGATPRSARRWSRFKDRGGRDMVLAMTHEEVVADLVRDIVQQLPPAAADRVPLPDQVPGRATRARRADPRPRVRHEGQLHPSTPTRPASTAATSSTTGRTSGSSRGSGCEADRRSAPTSGSWAAAGAHEFMVLNEHGEDTLVLCDACGYAANQQIARVRKPEPTAEEPQPDRGGRHARDRYDRRAGRAPGGPHRRGRPRPSSSSPATGACVTAIVRGDFEVNETKLANAVKAVGGLRPAHGRRDPGRRHGARLRLADRRPRHGRRRGRPGRRARRTWWPARTGTASTCATSTPAATSRRTWWSTSPTPARAIPARTAARRCAWRRGSRSATSSSSARDFTEALGATFLAEDGSRQPVGDGLVRDRAGPQRWPASWRPTTTTRASPGRIEVAPYRGPPGGHRRQRDPAVARGGRGALPAPDRCRGGRAVRRPRRVARGEVHRCRAARHADHRHRLASRRWPPAAWRSPIGQRASERSGRSTTVEAELRRRAGA